MIKSRSKKVIVIFSGLICITGIFIWYYFPFFMYKWFWYQNEIFRQDLDKSVVTISKLQEPPKEWDSIIIDDLSMKLPMLKITKIAGEENYLHCTFSQTSLLISDIIPYESLLKTLRENKAEYPVVSYQGLLSTYKSTPNDISFFNSREENLEAFQNQVCKAIAVPIGGIGNILSINTDKIKAICILSEKRKCGYNASISVYSQNEKIVLNLSLNGYKDKSVLKAESLSILSSIKMPEKQNDRNQVKRDISSIIKKYNKT